MGRHLRRRLARPSAGTVYRGLGGLALAGLVAGCVLIAVAAGQHHSFLAPPVRRHPPVWLTWPFRGLWHDLPANRMWLQRFLFFVLIGTLGCYAVALVSARRLKLRTIWVAVAAAYVALFLAPPLLLTDLFNYIGYARMGVLHHLNPYTHIPYVHPAPRHGPDATVYHLSNWHHLRSPYGPLFTLGTYALVPLGVAGAYWVYKAAVLAAGLGCLAITRRLAGRLDVSAPFALVLVGLNPIVLLYGQGGAHNDVFDVLFVLLAVDALLAGRAAIGGAATSAAAAFKSSAAALVPPAIAAAPDRRRALLGAVAGGALLGLATLLAFGPHLPAVGSQSRLVTEFSIPNILGVALGLGGETQAIRTAMEVFLAAGVAACTVWAWRTRDLVTALGAVTLLTLVALGWDMPWYLAWLLPFVALSRNRVFRVAAVCVVLWMTVQWMPLVPRELHKIGFTPHATKTWAVNKRYMLSLLK